MKKQNLKRMLNLRSFALVGIFSIAIFAASCNKQDDMPEPMVQNSDVELKKGAPAPSDVSIAQIAINAGFSELVGALAYVDAEEGTALVDMFLNGTDQYTVFAPTDGAFEDLYVAFDADEISDLPSAVVKDVLFYHVVEGRRASNSVVPKKGERVMETLLGPAFSVSPDGSIDAGSNSANIIAADISASNGIIHIIDTVILP